MGKLYIGEEGFVDLRKNRPATTETVNGWSPEADGAVAIRQPTEAVEVKAEAPASLPGRQKTAEGLDRPVVPVKVPKKEKAGLMRLVAVDDPATYAVVTAQQHHDLGKYEWRAVRSGHMYRMVEKPDGTQVVKWLHREAAGCKRSDRFTAFRDGDQRNLTPNNLQVVKTKEKAKEIKRLALLAAGK